MDFSRWASSRAASTALIMVHAIEVMTRLVALLFVLNKLGLQSEPG